jgi:hypothetical protein
MGLDDDAFFLASIVGTWFDTGRRRPDSSSRRDEDEDEDEDEDGFMGPATVADLVGGPSSKVPAFTTIGDTGPNLAREAHQEKDECPLAKARKALKSQLIQGFLMRPVPRDLSELIQFQSDLLKLLKLLEFIEGLSPTPDPSGQPTGPSQTPSPKPSDARDLRAPGIRGISGIEPEPIIH